ncbi:hypothetical protein J4H89_23385 (plasmid) [Ralstonia solanacearum]|nr:hypothetical protein J4H89_23385 [Ralstonia solanacearum]
MSRTAWWRLGWLFNRRAGIALAWVLVATGVAVAVNIVGIRAVGSIGGWEQWLRAHTRVFFLWRLGLYLATAYGWWRMRQRLRQREPAPEAHRRLLRTEIAAVVAVVLLEGSQMLRPD